jgi:hypothetical protein
LASMVGTLRFAHPTNYREATISFDIG